MQGQQRIKELAEALKEKKRKKDEEERATRQKASAEQEPQNREKLRKTQKNLADKANKLLRIK